MGNIAQRQGGLAFGIFKSIVLRIIEYYMEIKDYIDQRIHQQINWFERESKRNRHCYHTTKVLLTVTAAITPALASFIKDSTTVQIMVGIVSSLTAILANINGIFNFKDKYITFEMQLNTSRAKSSSMKPYRANTKTMNIAAIYS
ncbi:MAG: DUF4231 domain-containing protein [Bacteroidetes bacterium]|nr:DUF4231 domain-containing protein [Bacteroidota bacterium]